MVSSKRVTLRMNEDVYERMRYWSEREGLSINDYVAAAVEDAVARDSGAMPEYNDLFLGRFNQLIDMVGDVSSKLDNQAVVINHGLDTMVSIARGDDNMLLDDDIDGEL